MDRKSYLEKHWSPYPAMPGESTLGGRILSVDSKSIEILGKGRWSFSSKLSFPIEILREFDVVSLEIDNSQVMGITLLAPCLEEPLCPQSSPQMQRQWFEYLGKVRQFFAGKGFQEVQTPTLVSCPGTEPFLDLFSTELVQGSRRQKLYLPTSPELHLKKMLSSGYERIFEIRPCFRNGEITERHQPEFWMLEWYRAYSDLEQVLQDTLHLIEFLGGDATGFRRVSMQQLFQETLDFHLTPQTTLEELKELAGRSGLQAESYDLWDDVFYFIFVEKVEPRIPSEQPFILEKYPPSQAALARLTEDGWGERFELYWKGLEIANAFHELNDPAVQMQRSLADLQLKKALGKEVPELDEDFFRALRSGLPPSGGIALGLERLFMALHGVPRIQDLKVFSHSNLK